MGSGSAYLLFVDDEKSVLDTLRGQLNDSPLADAFAFEFAQSGEEVLDLIQTLEDEGQGAVVVVSDQIMPGMRGDELLLLLHHQQPELQKILLSGQADARSVQRAFGQAQLFRFLEKPWDRDFLIQTLTQAVSRYNEQQVHELLIRQKQMQSDWFDRMGRVAQLTDLLAQAAQVLHQHLKLHQVMVWHQPRSDADASVELWCWTPVEGIFPLYWLNSDRPPNHLPWQQLLLALQDQAPQPTTNPNSRTRCLRLRGYDLAVVHVQMHADNRLPPHHESSLLDTWFQLLQHELSGWQIRERLHTLEAQHAATTVRLQQAIDRRNEQLRQVVRETETHKRLLQADWHALQQAGYEVQLVVRTSSRESRRFIWYAQREGRLIVLAGQVLGNPVAAAQLTLRALLVLQHVETASWGGGPQLLARLHRTLRNTRTASNSESVGMALCFFDRTTGRLDVHTAGQRVWLLRADTPPFCQLAGPSLPLDSPYDPLYVDHRTYYWPQGGGLIFLSENLGSVLEADQPAAPNRLRWLRQTAERILHSEAESESLLLCIGLPPLQS